MSLRPSSLVRPTVDVYTVHSTLSPGCVTLGLCAAPKEAKEAETGNDPVLDVICGKS